MSNDEYLRWQGLLYKVAKKFVGINNLYDIDDLGDIITNYDVLVNKDIETLSKFLACISCKNNYKLQDYAQCFKEWLKQKSINDKRCSDLYFKIPESYNPTEA